MADPPIVAPMSESTVASQISINHMSPAPTTTRSSRSWPVSKHCGPSRWWSSTPHLREHGVAVQRPLVVTPGTRTPRPPLPLTASGAAPFRARGAAVRATLATWACLHHRHRPARVRRHRHHRHQGSRPPPPGAVATAPGYPPYGYGAPPVGGERAGFGIRLGGYLLDGLLYGLLIAAFVIPGVIMGVAAFDGCEMEREHRRTRLPGGQARRSADRWGHRARRGRLVDRGVHLPARLGKTGQTWGRRIVGIKVIGETTGEPIGFGRALGRQLFAAFISGQIFYLGYLWMLWDDKKQTWHDKVVSSIVVKV